MDKASTIKVQPGKIDRRIEDADTTLEVRFSKPIDESMLVLIETIQDKKYDLVEATRDECLARASLTLNRAQGCLAKKDGFALDELAQQLSHSALKIGAPQLLSSAIEVQGMARIGDFKAAGELLGRMELELFEVKSHYQ